MARFMQNGARGHMTVVCGTDLSENSTEAEDTAALIAKRLETDLKLVHVTYERAPDSLGLISEPSELLSARAKRIGQIHHIDATGVVLEGALGERMAEFARE